MNYQLIIQHLQSCGYSVSAANVLARDTIEVNVTIGSYTITLIHFEVDEITSMPSFYLKDPQQFPRLAHTLSFNDYNLASICVNVTDSVSVNYEVPTLAFEDSLKKHIELLTKCLTDPVENKKELLREFLASWYSLNNTKFNDVLCLVDSPEFCKLKVYVPEGKCGLKSSVLVHPENYDLATKEPFFKIQVAQRKKSPDLGCILPLPCITSIPWTASDLPQWFLEHFELLDADTKKKFVTTFAQTRKNIFWVIFNIDTSSGKSWFGLKFQYKKSKVNKTFPLKLESFTEWNIEACSIKLFDKSSLIPRGGAFCDLQDKHVLLVGCGSVGGYIADQLASCGLGNLTLVDSDTLSIENIYRHYLPIEYLHQYKTIGLQFRITTKYPWVNVIPADGCLLELRNDSIINRYDLIIIAIGSPTKERIFHDYCIKNEVETAIINTWTEGYGVGGHAVLDIPEQKGCLRCAYVDNENLCRGLVSNLNFLKPNQDLTRNLSGCGNAFLPYSNLSAIQTASITTDLALKFLQGNVKDSSKVSWKGSDLEALNENLELTDRYSSFSKSLLVTPLLNPECNICNE